VTANGTSLALHPGGINRRLLTAGTPEFLASLVTPTSRRAVLQAAVPGALHPSGGLKAFTTLGLVPAVEVEVPADAADGNQDGATASAQAVAGAQISKHSAARRALQGLPGTESTSQTSHHEHLQQEDEDGSQLAFYALPAWDRAADAEAGRQLLFTPAGSKRRRMTEGALAVYQRHMWVLKRSSKRPS
jgi:hypothetical protein